MHRLRKVIPWLTFAIALLFLVAHARSWDAIHVDGTALILLGILAGSPFLDVNVIRRIRIGGIEAEIKPREVQEAVEEAATELGDAGITPSPEVAERSEILRLVREEPSLGLAKLRIEVERMLNALYEEAGLASSSTSHPRGIQNLVRELEQHGVLPESASHSIQAVNQIANRAVHGERIREADATEIARLGVRLLETLRDTYLSQTSTPEKTEVLSQTEVDSYQSGQYRVKTVVPVLDEPKLNVRVLNQDALNWFLKGYEEYAEFLVGIEKVA